MLLFLSFALLILLIVFILSSHPLTLGFTLMVTSIIYSVCIYSGSLTPWLPYLLTMVFLSGMMVMFMYMASLSANENIKISLNEVLISSASLVAAWVGFYFFYPQISYNSLAMGSLTNSLANHSFNTTQKSYSLLAGPLSLSLILYLLVVLLVAVKITSVEKGPLKQTI